MAKCSYGQVGNKNSSEITKIKLKVMDYVFEYKGTDLTNAYLEYYFDLMKFIKYENGKIAKEGNYPIIFFSISATLDNKEYFFNFALEKSLDYLNNLNVNEQRDITKFINEGETLFQTPDGLEPIYFPSKDNFYGYDSVFKVTKLEENKMLFKIQCQNIFIWFIVNFNL